jgi:WhiB family transcriptional regulator, redox-sensing transcriptional regulator
MRDWTMFQRGPRLPPLYWPFDPDGPDRVFRSRFNSYGLPFDDDGIEDAVTYGELADIRGDQLGPLEVPEPTSRVLREPAAPVGFHGWEQAACKDSPTRWFFPPRGHPSRAAVRAKKLCDSCPVLDACRRYSSNESVGIWGGENTAQRRVRKREGKADAAT